ncbi:MAG: GxxExxY protein [Clostridiales bacterium]|nr:GxxExxY protein [Clostridiales bacterium]
MYKDESYQVQGAIFDVYKEMGSGFLAAVYHECMERELSLRQIPFESRKKLELLYKGKPLASRYVPDLICYGKIIVEIKAVKDIGPEHKAQLLNYLKATGMKLGLIANFGTYPKAQILRMANA